MVPWLRDFSSAEQNVNETQPFWIHLQIISFSHEANNTTNNKIIEIILII